MTHETTKTDILIAGGSFAGLALAAALGRESGGDLAITVVAPALPAPGRAPADIRASALSRASLHLLDHLGAWSGLAPETQTVTAIDITDSALGDALRPTRLSFDLLAGAPPKPRTDVDADRDPWADDALHDVHDTALPRMVIVENHRLASALFEAARETRGVTFREGRSVSAFAAGTGGVTATLDDGETLRARLLAAADGGASRLRDIAGIKTVGHAYEQSGIITIVEPERPHQGVAVQHFLPSGPFALLPMTHDRVCVTWSETATEARRILALDAAHFQAEVESRFGYKLGALTSISAPKAWPLVFAVPRGLVAERFALVGDAAHRVHPIAGQGINLGFRDVAALTESVIDAARLGLDIGDAAVLDRYERWRRFDNLTSATGFDVVNRAFSSDSTLLRSARGAVLSVIDRLPALKSWIADEAAGATGDVPRLLRAGAS